MVGQDVQAPAAGRPASLRDRWRQRDPDLLALKRSVRAAVLVPSVLAVATYAWGNPQATLVAVFGTFALLLFADFGGPVRIRLRAYLGLTATGMVLITLGTLCSRHPVAAVVGMGVAGFVILFAGSVSAQAAVGATAALLTFILPVAEPAAAGAIGPRLAGWCLAAAVSIPTVLLLWPRRWHDPLRRQAADAATALAHLVASHAEGRVDPPAAHRAAQALADLRAGFEATPYRPTGAGPTDDALARMVARLEWLGDNAMVPAHRPDALSDDPRARRIDAAAAEVLLELARCIDDDRVLSERHGTDRLAAAAGRLEDIQEEVARSVRAELLGPHPPSPDLAGDPTDRSLRELDPTYADRMLGLATAMTVELALRAIPGADGRGRPARWWDSVTAHVRAASAFLTFRSVWFRNSLRGAVALAAAVAVVEVTDVRHGFWVVLGTTSVLRSNALGTGATALRAVLGTAVGFAVGSLVLVVLGAHLGLLWIVLPVAVLAAGVAPSVISFAAGQAGFTVAVVVLFKIIHPDGHVLDPEPADRGPHGLDDLEERYHRHREARLSGGERDDRGSHPGRQYRDREDDPQQTEVGPEDHQHERADGEPDRGTQHRPEHGRARAQGVRPEHRRRAQHHPEPVPHVGHLDHGHRRRQCHGTTQAVAEPHRPEREERRGGAHVGGHRIPPPGRTAPTVRSGDGPQGQFHGHGGGQPQHPVGVGGIQLPQRPVGRVTGEVRGRRMRTEQFGTEPIGPPPPGCPPAFRPRRPVGRSRAARRGPGRRRCTWPVRAVPRRPRRRCAGPAGRRTGVGAVGRDHGVVAQPSNGPPSGPDVVGRPRSRRTVRRGLEPGAQVGQGLGGPVGGGRVDTALGVAGDQVGEGGGGVGRLASQRVVPPARPEEQDGRDGDGGRQAPARQPRLDPPAAAGSATGRMKVSSAAVAPTHAWAERIRRRG